MPTSRKPLPASHTARTPSGRSSQAAPRASTGSRVNAVHSASAPTPKPATPDGENGSRTSVWHLVLFAALIVLVFVLFVFLTRLGHQRESENRYNGFDFVPQPEGKLTLWVTKVVVNGQPYYIPFYHHPRDTEGVVYRAGVAQRFLLPEGSGRPAVIYLTFSPDAGATPVVAGVEISKITGYKYGILNTETHAALKSRADNASEHVVVTCAHATPEIAVLSFDLGANNAIYPDPENPYCVHLEYTSAEESLRVADRFAYGLLQIMQS